MKRRCIRQCFIIFYLKKKSHGPNYLHAIPAMQLSTHGWWAIFFFRSRWRKKHCKRWPSVKSRTKRKAVFQPSVFNKLCWFWGRISTKMWVFWDCRTGAPSDHESPSSAWQCRWRGVVQFSGELGWEKRAIDDRNSKTSLASLLWIQNQIEGHFGSLRVLLLGF